MTYPDRKWIKLFTEKLDPQRMSSDILKADLEKAVIPGFLILTMCDMDSQLATERPWDSLFFRDVELLINMGYDKLNHANAYRLTEEQDFLCQPGGVYLNFPAGTILVEVWHSGQQSGPFPSIMWADWWAEMPEGQGMEDMWRAQQKERKNV